MPKATGKEANSNCLLNPLLLPQNSPFVKHPKSARSLVKVPRSAGRGSGEKNHHFSEVSGITYIMLRDTTQMESGLSRAAWLRESPV
ncbi:hypothetical protein SAMN06269173_1261 [Hymenobacter mucosus]|uniref:Uncharacterized protein n=1 Tax=Hymenobacter mucosus TaxID=1411120 RepID=A0A239BJL2_9BACT|nr:hypothetical protein SAMN06269173_1261 [Hymenobacter mucosus]